MPIRINLLAEAQAAAEMRRKDPVKRGIWIGSFLGTVVVLWIAKLQMDISFENRSYNNVEAEWKGRMTTYSTVTNEQIKIGEVDHKLDELDLLRTNRFLWAPVFNALQQTIPQTMVDKIRVIKLSGSQIYAKEEGHDIGGGAIPPPTRPGSDNPEGQSQHRGRGFDAERRKLQQVQRKSGQL